MQTRVEKKGSTDVPELVGSEARLHYNGQDTRSGCLTRLISKGSVFDA